MFDVNMCHQNYKYYTIYMFCCSKNNKMSFPCAKQHTNYADCLKVKREYYQNYCMLRCVTQCSH